MVVGVSDLGQVLGWCRATARGRIVVAVRGHLAVAVRDDAQAIVAIVSKAHHSRRPVGYTGEPSRHRVIGEAQTDGVTPGRIAYSNQLPGGVVAQHRLVSVPIDDAGQAPTSVEVPR